MAVLSAVLVITDWQLGSWYHISLWFGGWWTMVVCDIDEVVNL